MRILCQQPHCQLGLKETERTKKDCWAPKILLAGNKVRKSLRSKHVLPFMKKGRTIQKMTPRVQRTELRATELFSDLEA